MSLNFDLTAVAERLGDRYDLITTSPETRGKPDDEQKWHPVTDRLIWLTMAVDLGVITEANLDEWCFRVALIEKLDGPTFTFMDGRKVSMTRKDIENHIGLRTNVSDKKRAAWVARIVAGADDRLKLASGEPEPGLAISAGEQIDLIAKERMDK